MRKPYCKLMELKENLKQIPSSKKSVFFVCASYAQKNYHAKFNHVKSKFLQISSWKQARKKLRAYAYTFFTNIHDQIHAKPLNLIEKKLFVY